MPAAPDPRLCRRPWVPLSSAEFDALKTLLPAPTRGRPPKDLRRTWDAIFWVACSAAPWAALPAHLGQGTSASRALRRWAKGGVLGRLLAAAMAPQATPPLAGLRWWLARAFRRVSRTMRPAELGLVRDRLQVAAALPATPLLLPDRILSSSARRTARRLSMQVKLFVARSAHAFAARPDRRSIAPDAPIQARLVAALRRAWGDWRLGVCGNRHRWRARAAP